MNYATVRLKICRFHLVTAVIAKVRSPHFNGRIKQWGQAMGSNSIENKAM